MKKLFFALSLCVASCAHAEILSNVAAVGDFIPETTGAVIMETAVPFWAAPTTNPTNGLINGGKVRFDVYQFGGVTKLSSTPLKPFFDPREACGVPNQFNQGDQGGNDSPKFIKTSKAVVAVGRNKTCQVFDAAGNRTNVELNYSYAYIANLANNKAWIFTSKTEELVGLDVIPDQSGIAGGAEEIVMTFHNNALLKSLRVLVVDSETGVKVSEQSYSIGTPN